MSIDGESKMASEIDYQTTYRQAQKAYIEGDLDTATRIANDMAQEYPDDPSILLLQGHICLRQQDYQLAKEKYNIVIEVSDDREIISLANQGLEQIHQEEESELGNFDLSAPEGFDMAEPDLTDTEDEDDWTKSIQFENMDWDRAELEDEDLEDPTLKQEHTSFDNSFSKSQTNLSNQKDAVEFEDVFGDNDEPLENTIIQDEEEFSWKETESKQQYNLDNIKVNLDESEIDYENFDDNYEEDFDSDGLLQESAAPTFVVSSEPNVEGSGSGLDDLEKMLTNSSEMLDNFKEEDYETGGLEPISSEEDGGSSTKNKFPPQAQESSDNDEESFFFVPDDLPDDFEDIGEIGADELPISGIFSPEDSGISSNLDRAKSITNIGVEDEDLAAISSISDVAPVSSSSMAIQPEVDVSQGVLAQFDNATLFGKQLIDAGATGIITCLAVFIVSFFNIGITQEGQEEKVSSPWLHRAILSLVAGVAGAGTTFGIGCLLTNKHIERYTTDLQTQFESIYQGNYKVKATIYSQDEFGQLAAGFNQMTKMIKTTTSEAKKRAEETERAREDLQRQVIRLLDDVEGAARGDLMVQAEVTADVLGAVADAFNLTITNLREIVKQVKKAALQVNKGSTDSELFARNQSSDALRMAEELAVTLNSVQMMTDSIQRVAENAREAEEVARSSSVTALKGGDAVERTVAGILQIRETVSETTRKVKRLAEASQQISTIVAVISQISSRTNLLALNASIQAAKAGEAGKGFAIVADEVRQLADRSAKSLQEIEQIVLQIQTETGSVMSAMEEGIQQVLDVTERSEQAKRSLEDIIQVSNRIDALVRSITADTVEQRENSRAVAKVMQAVELTAQATSQESQRVAGSLQNLVVIAKDLLSSVERFKVGEDQNNN